MLCITLYMHTGRKTITSTLVCCQFILLPNLSFNFVCDTSLWFDFWEKGLFSPIQLLLSPHTQYVHLCMYCFLPSMGEFSTFLPFLYMCSIKRRKVLKNWKQLKYTDPVVYVCIKMSEVVIAQLFVHH